MRKMIWLVLALAACTSAEEQAREREMAMIEAAKADSIAEAEFVEDSLKLAASISLDTIVALRVRDQQASDDPDYIETVHLAVTRAGQTCQLDFEKYKLVAVGDTLTCQWGPPE